MLREMLNVAGTSKRIDDWGVTSSGRRQKATRCDRCDEMRNGGGTLINRNLSSG